MIKKNQKSKNRVAFITGVQMLDVFIFVKYITNLCYLPLRFEIYMQPIELFRIFALLKLLIFFFHIQPTFSICTEEHHKSSHEWRVDDFSVTDLQMYFFFLLFCNLTI